MQHRKEFHHPHKAIMLFDVLQVRTFIQQISLIVSLQLDKAVSIAMPLY